jgi:hypothetical protein
MALFFSATIKIGKNTNFYKISDLLDIGTQNNFGTIIKKDATLAVLE